MRHNIISTKRAGQGAGTNGRDRAAEDVAGMEWDELCELVGHSPAGDSPYAEEYFEAAAREIVNRIDRRQAVPAGT